MDNVPYSSLVEAHQDLLRKGYDKNYNVEDGKLMVDGSGHTYSPSQLSIDEFYRFEGESDPADNSIIYAVSANDGTKGTLVDAFGAQGSMKVAQFVLKVEEKMQNVLNRKYNLIKSNLINTARKEEKLLIGLAAGAVVGTVIGLLLAPKGKDFTEKLASQLKDIAEGVGKKSHSLADKYKLSVN